MGEYRRLLHRHFHFEGPIHELSRHQIGNVIEGLKGKPSEQKHAFVAIRTMMNWCVRRGFLNYSPVPPLTFKYRPRERFLSDAELAAVWHRAASMEHPFGPIVQLLILTGQRRGEIVGLRSSWINDGRIQYPSEFTKNKRPHTVPLATEAQRIIEDLPGDTDLLFPHRYNSTRPFNGFGKLKADLDRDLGIEPYTLHDLRRTFSSMMAKLGTPIHVTERMLNHVSGVISGVAAVYNRHAYIDEMAEAYARYEDHLRSIFAMYGRNP